jgi:hypothetical protein
VGDVRLIARLGWQPFGAAIVQVGEAGTRSAAPGSPVGAAPARLPLSLAGRWAVIKDSGSEPGTARLLAFFTVFATPDQRQAVLDQAQVDAPRLIAALEATGTSGPTPRDTAGPSGSFGDDGFTSGGNVADDYSFGD